MRRILIAPIFARLFPHMQMPRHAILPRPARTRTSAGMRMLLLLAATATLHVAATRETSAATAETAGTAMGLRTDTGRIAHEIGTTAGQGHTTATMETAGSAETAGTAMGLRTDTGRIAHEIGTTAGRENSTATGMHPAEAAQTPAAGTAAATGNAAFPQTASAQAAPARLLDPSEYIYPIRDVQRLCSANFGEIRPGHFHAGVDIKTDGVEGKPLVAVADGHVSRVTVTAGGYGRAVYLTLRNGKIAVYGHLQHFRDDIERSVHEERLRRRANSVDLTFDAGRWPVRQGDVIGYSGNSGASMGPHLHFELRESPAGLRYNLVREGLVRPADDLPPRIVRLHYIEVDSVRGVPVRSRPESYPVVRTAEGRYRLTRSEPVPAGRKGYLVAEVSDRRNGVYNTFGVWRVTAFVDGERYFEYRMDGFPFREVHCCDAVCCYPLQLASRNEAIRLARAEGAPARFYPVAADRGLLRTEPGARHRIRIEAEDDSGNRSSLEFDLLGRPESFRAEAADTAAAVLRPDRAGTLHLGSELSAGIPAGALYEPLFCRPERLAAPRVDSGLVALSPAYRVFDATTPLHRPVTVSMRAAVPRAMQLRAVAAVRNAKGRWTCAGGTYTDGALCVTTRSSGDIAVVADTLPPTIEPLFTPGANPLRASSLRFSASDNFSGIASWELLIDGGWVPCDRFPMRGTLAYPLPASLPAGRHTVRLRVTDGCGNTALWDGTFYR